jgi:hypothetical protein
MHAVCKPFQFRALGLIEAFSLNNPDIKNLPPEAVEVALDVARIKDPGTRKQVAEAIRTLLATYSSGFYYDTITETF